MKRLSAVPILLLVSACATGGAVSSPGPTEITVQIQPNPIVAQHINGDTYSFPFDVVVRNTGSHAVTINHVTADVTALGGVHIANETWDASRINSLGYSTTVPPNGELRYHFAPQKSVSDERLFGGVSADLEVFGTDDAGKEVTATTKVTVTR